MLPHNSLRLSLDSPSPAGGGGARDPLDATQVAGVFTRFAPLVALEAEIGLDVKSLPDSEKIGELTKILRTIEEAAFPGISSKVQPSTRGMRFLSKPLTPDQVTALNEAYNNEHTGSLTELIGQSRQVPLVESQERVVPLEAQAKEADVAMLFSPEPFHEACGAYGGKSRIFWARESVAEKIVEVARILNKVGLAPEIMDAYRPPEVQQGLLLRRADWIRQQHPDWSDEQVARQARVTTSSSPELAAHMSACAIDYRLVNLATAEPLPIGNSYPEGGPRSSLRFPYLTEDEFATREIFELVSRAVGFAVYLGENWHVSDRDRLYLIHTGAPHKTAHFGPIKGFDMETGEVMPYSADEMKVDFPVFRAD